MTHGPLGLQSEIGKETARTVGGRGWRHKQQDKPADASRVMRTCGVESVSDVFLYVGVLGKAAEHVAVFVGGNALRH